MYPLLKRTDPLALLGGVVFAAALFFLARTIVTYPISADSYTHMGVGQYIIQNKHIPRADDLSFKVSEPSLEWITHSWLGDTLLYMVSAVGPRFAAVFLLIPLAIFSLWLLYSVLMTLQIPIEFKLISLSVAAMLSASFWKLHPLLFSIPLSLLFVRIFLPRQKDTRIYWATPILFLLWANLSGGYILIPIIFLLLVLIIHFFRRPAAFTWTLLLVFPVSILATAISPLGLRLWGYPITLVAILYTVRSVSSLPGTLLSINQNFTKAAPSTVIDSLFLIYIVIFCILLLAVLVNRRREFLNIYGAAVPLILFLMLGCIWIRFIPLAAFGSMPLFAALITTLSNTRDSSPRYRMAIVGANIVLLGIAGYFIVLPPQPLRIKYPEKQIAIIKKFNLTPNILTSFDYTGYVLWALPGQKVALDAQDDLFDENALVNIYTWPQTIKPETVRSIVDRYGINTILVNKNIGGLAASLSANPDWALIYFDTSGFLFVKKTSVSARFLDAQALHYVDLTRNLGTDPAHVSDAIAQLETFTHTYPESILAAGQLASLYRITKNFAKGEEVLNRIPRAEWDYTVYTEMGRLKAAQNLCIPAQNNFLAALRNRSEQNYSRTVLDLAVLYAGCFGDKARAKHYFLRYNSFLITPPEQERLRQLMKTFDITLE